MNLSRHLAAFGTAVLIVIALLLTLPLRSMPLKSDDVKNVTEQVPEILFLIDVH